MLCWSEFFVSAVLLIGTLVLRRSAKRMMKDVHASTTTVADYSVKLRNVPPDAVEQQILQFIQNQFGVVIEVIPILVLVSTVQASTALCRRCSLHELRVSRSCASTSTANYCAQSMCSMLLARSAHALHRCMSMCPCVRAAVHKLRHSSAVMIRVVCDCV